MAVYDTVAKVIAEVDRLFPNPYTDAEKMNWINDAIIENYLWTMEAKTETIATVADQSDYDIPSDCRFDSIKIVKVDGEYHYPQIVDGYQNIQSRRYYQTDEEKLGINPAPQESGLDIFLKYIQKPALVSSTSDTIPFVEGTDHVVIYWVMIKAAFGMQDDASVNNYTIKYNDAVRAAKLKVSRGVKLKRTRNVMTKIGRGIK